jgi:hypothetical protein
MPWLYGRKLGILLNEETTRRTLGLWPLKNLCTLVHIFLEMVRLAMLRYLSSSLSGQF